MNRTSQSTAPVSRWPVRLGLLVTVLLVACAAPHRAPVVRVAHTTSGAGGALACVDRYAARAGAEVLARGGNAVDAAVACAFALAVSWPPAGNLGGGGLALVHDVERGDELIDFRETAPAAVGPDLFLDADGRYDARLAEHPWRCVGVPGSVAGLSLLHQRHGRLPWNELLDPAIALAERGIDVDATLAHFLAASAVGLEAGAPPFLDDQGRVLREGDLLVQPELAATLRALRERGPEGFYQGPVAAALAAGAHAGGGFLTEADLATYRPVLRDPLRIALGDQQVLAPPPPSAGGVVMAQVLGQLDRLPWSAAPWLGVDEVHLWAECSRRAFAERARSLADPDRVPVDLERLLAPHVLDAMAASVEPERATPSEALGPPVVDDEPEHTTHLSVVDGDGLAVSLTTTLEAAFGSQVVAPGTGVLLNNQLRDFNRAAGLTTRGGLVGTEPNLPGPGKRPLTSMTPVIVLDADGRVRFVTGSPGGRTIISTVTRLVLAVVAHGVPPELAVAQPRLHQGWFPDRIEMEPDGLPEAVRDALAARGHQVLVRSPDPPLFGSQGCAHSVFRQPDGSWLAVGDLRRDGWAAAVAR